VTFRRFSIRLLLAALLPLLAANACDRSITALEETSNATTCFSCHTDDNARFAGAEVEWGYSRHASGRTIDRTTASCNPCHTHQGFVQTTQGGAAPASVANPTVIHCFTCHAPHTRGDLSLRVRDPVALANGEAPDMGRANLCAYCHRARQNVDTYVRTPSDTVTLDSHWGPHHGPQSDLFAGENGYEYPLVPYFDGPHLDETEDGCLDCHFTARAGAPLGGHSFHMRSDAFGEERLNTGGCNASACHDGDVDDFDYDDIQGDVVALLATLENLLRAAGLLDAEGNPVEGRVVASSDSAGALWNFLLVREDGSRGVHNPEYGPDLLGSSILFMGGTLPGAAPTSRP
jgi:hypothetical protein